MKNTCVSILLLLFSCFLHAQNDCPDAIIICGDANYFDLEAEGPGVDEFLGIGENPCASGENNTIWLKIQINEGGTLGFNLTPENPSLTTDYDFWLFGPFDDCVTELPFPIRCSTTNPLQAGVGIITGMNETETDTSEGPGPDGNGFVNWIEVEDNQFFFLVVDRPHGSGNFSMEWTGTATFYPVPVFNNPDNIPLDIAQCDTDFVDDATSIFDLTIYEEMFYGDQEQEDIIITYHENLNDSTLGTDPIENPAEYSNTSQVQTIYLRMTNIFTNCYSNHTFNIEVLPTPQQGLPIDLESCDEGNDGIEQFNLTANDNNIRNGNPLTLVTYHTSLEDAMDGSNEVGPLFSNQVPFESQTIWARLVDANGCFSHDFFSFDIVPLLLPQFNNPENIPLDLFECDNDGVNDQTTVFDLTQHEEMLLDEQDNIFVTYHTTFAGADNGVEEIETPTAYTNISSPEVIYIRMVDLTTGCYNITDFTLNVTGIEAGEPNDLVLCDIDENGIREFDLSVNDEILINGEENAEVFYYASEEDAENDINPIGPLYENTVSYEEETIWARVEKNTGECLGLAFESFTIRVEPLPYFNNPTNMSLDLTECDNDGVDDGITTFDLTTHAGMLKGEQDNVEITWYLDEASAETGIDFLPDPEEYTNISNPQTVYMRITNTVFGCYDTTSFQLIVVSVPQAPEQEPLQECDLNNDHFADFNLEAVLQQIENEMGESVIVTIHETIDDATFGTNDITDTEEYENISADTQTLYIRVQAGNTECADIVPLQLIVNPVPVAVEPEIYPMCDNGADDTDGEAIFDLTAIEEEILGMHSPADFTVSFHELEEDAWEGTPTIPTPASWPAETGSVWARVTNNDTGCFDVVEVRLLVNELPMANEPTPLTLCDEDINNPEQEIFDLTAKIPEIIGTQEGLDVTFHIDYDEAVDNENPVEDPYNYVNEPPVETIFVRVTNAETGCYRIVLMDVRVAPLPIIVPPTPDEVTTCDTDGNGMAQFNLDDLVEGMINNAGDEYVISFHETLEDAGNNANPIPNTSSYVNPTPYEQDIAVRITNTLTGCFNTYLITLHVVPAPQAPALEDITLCDDQDDNGQDGLAFVDLTVQDAVIEEALGVAPGELTIHYFTDEDYANEGTPRITVPENFYAADQQWIWVRVEDPVSECYSISSFQILLNEPLLLETPSPLTVCNSELPNDAQETFDLTVKDNEILGELGIGQGFTVEYFESQADVDANTPIANPQAYTNPDDENPKTLYVVVTTDEGCRSYTTLTIRVLPLPQPDTTPDALVMCDDNGDGDGFEEFDLTEAEDDIRDNDFSAVITYHTSLEDAEAGINPIATPEAYVSDNATIWVRMEANTTNDDDPACYQVVELQLQVTPLPGIGDNPVYAICEPNTDFVGEFDLKTFIENILGEGADENYDITFYLDQAAMDAGTAMPVIYENESNPQTILVHVEDLITGCEITSPMTLIVEEAAVANPVTENPMLECDVDGLNDGFFEFDLTIVEEDVLGTQDPDEYTVTYYLTEEEAIAAENPIETPEAFINTVALGQTIWVNVMHTGSISQCSDVTSFDIVVELLPEPIISTDNNILCIDYITQNVIRPVYLDSNITPNGHSYDWYLDGVLVATTDTQIYEATEPGLYTVIVTSANNCVSEVSAEFEVIQSGPASPVGTGYYVTEAFSDEQTITVLVEGYGEYEYRLDEDGMWQSSNVFVDVAPGSHTVYVRDITGGADMGCGELPLTGVSVIDYPRFFTPNGDGFNDTWNIIGLEDFGAETTIYIFDRYGKFIKQISSAGEGWDGTYNGQNLPSTDYWFTVEYPEYVGDARMIKEFKAHFSLKR